MSTWYIIIKVVYIFATALSFIFSLFFVFEVQKSKVPYGLFKYPLNRHTYNFHRVVKVLLFLWKITFKGSLNMSSQWIGWVAIYTKQRAISQHSTAMPHSFHWTVEVASSLLVLQVIEIWVHVLSYAHCTKFLGFFHWIYKLDKQSHLQIPNNFLALLLYHVQHGQTASRGWLKLCKRWWKLLCSIFIT